MANPGTILLSPETRALAEGFVQVGSLGPMSVKGLRRPIEVFKLTGASSARSRLQAAAARGLTRFVGRDAEIELLRQGLERAREGRGQVIALVGEPGVGKSRLVWEFTHSHRTRDWFVLEAASASYSKATTYFPIIELLKSYFQIEPRDDARKIREKLTGKILSLDRTLEPTARVFLSLLDVPVDDPEWARLDPPQRRRQTLDTLKRLLLRESQVQPLLVVVEDLHWIDSETQALLDTFIEGVPASRVLLLVSYRPEYTHAWASKSYYQQLRLDVLPDTGVNELVDALVGQDPALSALKPLLIERTDANPFFLEEAVRALTETKMLVGTRGAYRLTGPVRSLQLPATAQAILAARIDRLAPEDKRLLQAAAVVGKDVALALLEVIAEEPGEQLRGGLARLQAAEFLYEARLFPELEYTFKHALTHEVTYGSLLRDRRRELHERLVSAIEALYPGRLVEHTERLAHHAVRGELHEKAVRYLREAGLKAASRSALTDALGWFEQALTALRVLPESRSMLEQSFDVRLEMRAILTQLGEIRRGLENLREAESIAERLNDEQRRGRACAFAANIQVQIGQLDEAIASGNRALAIARSRGDLEIRIVTTTYLEQAYYLRGEYDQVVKLATENIAALPANLVYEHLGSAAPAAVYDRGVLAASLAHLGRFADAQEHQAEAIRLAEPTRHAFTTGAAYNSAGVVYTLKGDWATAQPLIEHSVGVLRSANVFVQLPIAVACSAWVLAATGDFGVALSRVREGEPLTERQAARGFIGNTGWSYYSMGRACLLLNRLDEASRLGQLAIESSPCHPGYEAHALHLLADISTHPDHFNIELGEKNYRKALALAEPRGMRPLIAHCHLGLGKLYRRTGKRDQAQEHLTTATTMYRDMGMTYWLEQTTQQFETI
jgi:predicted ATPase